MSHSVYSENHAVQVADVKHYFYVLCITAIKITIFISSIKEFRILKFTVKYERDKD